MSGISLEEQTGHVPESLRAKLRSLRQQIVGWIFLDGASRVLWLIIALATLDLLLDLFFHMDLAQRGVMLALMLIAIAGMVFARIVRPMALLPTDDALCLQVEDKHQSGESLISAIQFSRMSDLSERGVSMQMVRATIESGRRAVEQVSFGSTLNVRQFYRNLIWLLLGLVTSGAWISAIGNEGTARIWFQRNVLLQNRTWPQDVRLDVVGASGGVITLPRGEDWHQLVRLAAQDGGGTRTAAANKNYEVFIDFLGRPSRPSQRLRKARENDLYQLTVKTVMSEFAFQARARDNEFWSHDVVSDLISVQLVDQPALENLELSATIPQYAGGTVQPLPPGQGPYFVLQGSRLSLKGVANKPLSSAAISVAERRWDLSISDETSVAGTIPAGELIDGTYSIELTDVTGISARRPASFGLRIRADRPPRVRARLAGVSNIIVAQAMIPIICQLTDDFAISDARIAFQWQLDLDREVSEEGSIQFNEMRKWFGQPEIQSEEVLELQSLGLPTGATLTIRVEADDKDEISGPKTGSSPEFLLRIVTEEQLRTDLLRREKEQREQFQRLLKDQQQLLTDCRALQAETTDNSPFNQSQKDNVRKFQNQQKQIGTGVGSVAKRLQALLIEAEHNRIEESDSLFHRRLTRRIIEPMVDLAVSQIPFAEDLLHKTRRLDSQDPPDSIMIQQRDSSLEETIKQQRKIVNQMNQILTHMIKTEGFQEAVNLMYEVETAQKKVHELTRNRFQQLLEDLFHQGGQRDPKKGESSGPSQ